MRKTFFVLLMLVWPIFSMGTAPDTIIYVSPVGISSLEPGRRGDLYSFQAYINIFESLVTTTAKPVGIAPCLAQKWEVSADGKKWTFQLRRNVFFHNGEPFNASAVVKAFNRCLRHTGSTYDYWKALFPFLIRVKARDTHTVEFYLSKRFVSFLAALSHPAASIPAPGAFRNGQFLPVGTGPFKFNHSEKNGDFIMDGNDHYWGGPVRLGKLIFKTIPNSFSRMMEVKSGSADVSLIRDLGERDMFLGKTEFKILSELALRVHYLAFNTRKPPFNNPDVRRAFAHLINKEMLVKLSFQDLALTAVSPIPPQLPGFNKQIKDYPYDLQQARNILKKAGLEKGFSCSLYYSDNNPAVQKITDIIATNAKSILVTIKKIPKPFGQIIRQCGKGEHDMVLMGWSGGPDPYLFLTPVLTIIGGSYNFAFYNNPEFNDLLEQYRSALSVEAGKVYIEKSQEIFFQDSPWIPLFHFKNTAVFNHDIKNLSFDVNGLLVFKDAFKMID